MTAFYNEIDPYAAQWLRNLIKAGHIAPGVVDERSIEDIAPDELLQYTQCHFFAGVGVWSLALRRAGWPDDRPVWTGSCPCQPFSAAGQGAGFTDARHLWPSFAWLIANAQPAVVFGEQVASKAVEPWVDLVHADMEALDYAFGAVPFPSAGVGAPHIRDRLFWVAESGGERRERRQGAENRRVSNRHDARRVKGNYGPFGSDEAGVLRLGNPSSTGLAQCIGDSGIPDYSIGTRARQAVERAGIYALRLAHSDGSGCSSRSEGLSPTGHRDAAESGSGLDQERIAGPVNGAWADADWILCRDDRWRPVEPGTFPLAHGDTSRVGRLRADWSSPAGKDNKGWRVGRLRAYGNAINAEAAKSFIEAYLDAESR